MTKTMIAAAVLAGAAATGAGATDIALQPGETLLEVQSEGETVVLPDAALVSVGVVSTGGTAREATAANAADMARVVKAIKAAGIADRYIRTQQINVSPRFARASASDWQGQAQITGYVAQNSVSVTVTDLAKASGVIDAAFGAGANSVSGPNLTLLDHSKALDAARRDGIAKARAEAATYADSLGMKVARVLRVSERGRAARPVDYVTAYDMVSAPPPPPPLPAPRAPIATGEMRQNVTVWVDFALTTR